MRLSDFHYDLPDELIAQRPSERRGDSRMLHLARDGVPHDRLFTDIAELLRAGDLLVLNDTRVMPARLHGHKATGGRVEVLVERVVDDHEAMVHIRASKSPKVGGLLRIGEYELETVGREEDLFRVRCRGAPLAEVMQRHGHMPLPPYIRRDDRAIDRERYQTVYAERPGAVAAPTAGLHFDAPLLAGLADRGVATARVTLHVGAGTFQPVRTEDIEAHRMHSEWLEVGEATVDAVRAARARGGRVIAVGTTSVRSLETAAAGGELVPYRGETRLFIRPGFRFRVVDAMLTNFHLPESTLLMLVCAFAGYPQTMAAYRHAVARRYRFFSYGDAMFIESPASVAGGGR